MDEAMSCKLLLLIVLCLISLGVNFLRSVDTIPIRWLISLEKLQLLSMMVPK